MVHLYMNDNGQPQTHSSLAHNKQNLKHITKHTQTDQTLSPTSKQSTHTAKKKKKGKKHLALP